MPHVPVFVAPLVAAPFFAQPFTPLPPPSPIALQEAIRHQIEYYLSEENLERDIFVRRKMDAEGN